MIGVIFHYAGENVEVRIIGTNCLFRTQQFGSVFTTIDGLKIEKAGAVKEFPDLKDDKDWKEKTISRFKLKIKELDNEEDRMNYIVNDLMKFGYQPLYIQRTGQRTKRFK